MSNPLGQDARMSPHTAKLPALSTPDSREATIEFAARLWLRTALAAWLLWLGSFACVLIAGVLG